MGRALRLDIAKYGSWDGWAWGTGIALPGTHPARTLIPHPGYTPPATPVPAAPADVHVPDLNTAVGLISVDQLSLSGRISGFQGMTEVYNLSDIGRINNHSLICQNK